MGHDYSDINNILKERLDITTVSTHISTIFQNQNYSSKINYKPYFQRNYVWDDEKATYFIESLLLGTEVPPLVFFKHKCDDTIEVIDGRQRYETIKRFLEDKLVLKDKGLHNLKMLSGKKYSQLDNSIKSDFSDTVLRTLEVKIIGEPQLDDETEDKIKKEIFFRYNSGITKLSKYDIERAIYIKDELSLKLYEEIDKDDELFEFLCNIIFPKSKNKSNNRDKLNILVLLVRKLITLHHIPIYSYARRGSKSDIIYQYYCSIIAKNNAAEELENFKVVIEYIKKFYSKSKVTNFSLYNNRLLYEVLYWAIAIVIHEKKEIKEDDINDIFAYIDNSVQFPEIWNNINDNIRKDINILFQKSGSHYTVAINNRYNFIANIFKLEFQIYFQKYLKNSENFKKIMSYNNEYENYCKINKCSFTTFSVGEIILRIEKSKFLIRPIYQRSEVKDLKKASYLIESVLLGVKLLPIFVYKRKDHVYEVIDGQQRLLIILGFLGADYINELGETEHSNKHKFRLSNLKVLSELNGKTIDTLDREYEKRIKDFLINVIEIDYDDNPKFDKIDLFLRLNTKSYVIKENTFEKWNAYINRHIVEKVKDITFKYEKKIFKARDKRMELEELITSLAYIDYKMKNNNTGLNIFKRNDRIWVRIRNKDNITKTLFELSDESPEVFLKSLSNVELFIEKILLIIENEYSRLRQLFSYKGRYEQYKTDQNFYFLWLLLFKTSTDEIKAKREELFKHISGTFSLIQKTPDDYTIDMFLNMLNIKEK